MSDPALVWSAVCGGSAAALFVALRGYRNAHFRRSRPVPDPAQARQWQADWDGLAK